MKGTSSGSKVKSLEKATVDSTVWNIWKKTCAHQIESRGKEQPPWLQTGVLILLALQIRSFISCSNCSLACGSVGSCANKHSQVTISWRSPESKEADGPALKENFCTLATDFFFFFFDPRSHCKASPIIPTAGPVRAALNKSNEE